MALRGFLISAFAVLACATAFVVQRAHAGSTDAIFISSGGSTSATEAAPYDSEYAAAAREMGSGMNTPEADARPGEYYFLLAVHAFRKNDFTFAIQMYEVAAAWAFKPAEYNLAIMYARGQGIPADLPRGMAWMALAAERNEKRYVDAREVIYGELTKEQFEQANGIWRELKKTYGDEVALRRAKARWAQVRASMTGSRVGSVGNLSVGMPNANDGDPSNQKGQKTGANVHTTAGTPAELTGGTGVDGSIAYRQLRESDNPYDPKFKPGAIGTATVGKPTQVKDGTHEEAKPDQPDAAKHE
ncbi:MAG TPA: sel1 repeat family protein [Rudaea sp.]|nr:sel1 repeat family protein [Rudaea sp.]